MLKTSQRQRGSVRRHGKQRRRAAPNNAVAQRVQERRDRHAWKMYTKENFLRGLNHRFEQLARHAA